MLKVPFSMDLITRSRGDVQGVLGGGAGTISCGRESRLKETTEGILFFMVKVTRATFYKLFLLTFSSTLDCLVITCIAISQVRLATFEAWLAIRLLSVD